MLLCVSVFMLDGTIRNVFGSLRNVFGHLQILLDPINVKKSWQVYRWFQAKNNCLKNCVSDKM